MLCPVRRGGRRLYQSSSAAALMKDIEAHIRTSPSGHVPLFPCSVFSMNVIKLSLHKLWQLYTSAERRSRRRSAIGFTNVNEAFGLSWRRRNLRSAGRQALDTRVDDDDDEGKMTAAAEEGSPSVGRCSAVPLVNTRR